MEKPLPGHLVAAYITHAHGLKGQLGARCLLEGPMRLQGQVLPTSQAGLTLTVTRVQVAKPGTVLLTCEGLADRNAAEALRGLTLYLPRQALPEHPDEIYLHDLLDRPVHAPDGTRVGTVMRLQSTTAHDYLEIERPGAKSVLIPVHADYLNDLHANPLMLTELGQALTQL